VQKSLRTTALDRLQSCRLRS